MKFANISFILNFEKPIVSIRKSFPKKPILLESSKFMDYLKEDGNIRNHIITFSKVDKEILKLLGRIKHKQW